MSEMFQGFEQDFSKYLNSIKRKVQNFPNQTKQLKELALNEGFNELTQAEKCLRQMEIELPMMSSQARVSLQQQVRRYREDFQGIKRSFKDQEIRYADQKNKETLMGARLEYGGSEQKQRLLNTNSLLADQLQRIQDGRKVALECQGIVIEASNNLKGQRDQLENAIRNNRDVGDNLSKGNRLIKGMSRRAIMNRILMLLVGLFLVGAIVLVIYFKFS